NRKSTGEFFVAIPQMLKEDP
ncbi:unnamed protein product, partial [Allacma fusca]